MGTSCPYSVMLPTPDGGRISCSTYLTPEQRDHYRAAGYEVDLVLNSCPEWAVEIGLMPTWFFVQDVFNFRLGHYFKRSA